MATYDTWGGSWGTSWALSWTREIVIPPEPPEIPEFVPGDGGSAGRRRRVRILLRVDGQEYEVSDLKRALDVIKAAKDEVPQAAVATAHDIIATGKRIGDAKREEAQAVQLVEAPSSVRAIIEDRLAEMQRLHWRLVEARLRDLEDDDDVMAVI